MFSTHLRVCAFLLQSMWKNWDNSVTPTITNEIYIGFMLVISIILIVLGIILAVHWTTFFYSIQLSTVAIGLLTFSTFPIFATLF